MFQLASLLMQNFSSPCSPEELEIAKSDMMEMAKQILSSEQNGGQLQNSNHALMAELARQIVLSAGHGPRATSSSSHGNTHQRPLTVAQLTQQQTASEMVNTAGQTAENRLFLHQQYLGRDLSKMGQSASMANSTSPSNETLTSSDNFAMGMYHQGNQQSNGGPIRRKLPGQRILRPGIDNFGRFESVANPGVIMHAMELLRRKDRKKRGPKEKETFPVFLYCLPNKTSKLPKFSSLDPVERSLVDKHQQEGYGYPAQDYINGIPRKTQLCLSFTAEKFHSFMTSIYPGLEGRMYDLYRIDKTRRLIRIEVKSPRELKDMKYQGSVIIIPYDNYEDRPAPVIHRTFDDCFNGGTNGTLPVANFNIPLAALPESFSDAMEVAHNYRAEQPVFPGQPVSMTLPTKSPEPQKNRKTSSCSPQEMTTEPLEAPPVTECQDSSEDSQHTNCSINTLDNILIINKAGDLRNGLNDVRRIHIRPESICEDVLDAYRQDPELERHNLSVCFQMHADIPDVQHDEDVDPGAVIVMFWEEVFRKYFQGDKEHVPVINPADPSDLFTILGRVLFHGLVLANYIPLKFSMVCFTFLLTDTCSDRLLLSSLYNVMSESEKMVLESGMDEARAGIGQFATQIEPSLKVILGSYGCKEVPAVHELEPMMTQIAKSFLIHQINWPLLSLRDGFNTSDVNAFKDLKEEDVVALYQALTPLVPNLLERVTYIYSTETETNDLEKQVKVYFEQYLFKLSRNVLLRLLYQWCGFDCLCVSDLYVKFSGDQELVNPMFSPKQAVLCLPSVCTSSAELKNILENQLPSLGFLDT